MRALLIGAALGALGILLPGPASAQSRDEFMRRTVWHCEHGDREACHIAHLYRECEERNRYACEELEHERYFERWYEREREHAHEHEHEHEHEHRPDYFPGNEPWRH